MSEVVAVETRDRVAHLRITRPKSLNAIDLAVMRDLPAALAEIDRDPGLRVVVLSGEGPHFGAGYDLKVDWGQAFGGRGPMHMRAMLKACVAFEFAPWDCSKPVIAMVRGHCLAGSCELAMMCCLTFAAETARFGEPEIRFSTAPPAIVMPWIVGLKKARELLYTGDTIDAREAQAIGMVNRVLPDDRLEDATFRYARRAAAISLEGLQMTKAAINRGAEIAGLRQALANGVDLGAVLDATETETFRTFMAVRHERGLAAAIRWRESQFEEG